MDEEVVEGLLKLIESLNERIDFLDSNLRTAISDTRALSLAVLLLTHSQKPVRDVIQDAAQDMVNRDPVELADMLRESFRSTLHLDV